MRWTQTLIATSKDIPTDAQTLAHQLMLRAGLIRPLAPGTYNLLPLGLRSLHKAASLIRQEMDAIGCSEISLPALQPLDLWQKTGRDVGYGENLFTLKDRHGRSLVLAPTREEAVTELIAATVTSYKQLPLSLYQIQTSFTDEFRPRAGLQRLRESLVADAYSFHASAESLNERYHRVFDAFQRIFARCGINAVPVEAATGPIAGSGSHEFMVLCDAGEDDVLQSEKGNYAANLQRCAIGDRPINLAGQPTGDLETIHTPGAHSISDVATFLKVPPSQILKTLVYQATPAKDAAYAAQWIIAVVRGDHDVNPCKLLVAAQKHFNVASIELVDTPEVRERFAIGFVGPNVAMRDFFAGLIIDPDAAQDADWVAGANEIDYHVRHFNWFREAGDRLADPTKAIVQDIRNARDGDPSPLNDGGVLHGLKGLEVGHVFKLGTQCTSSLNALFLDDRGQKHPILMGCYRLAVGRLLVAAVESSHDDKGIIWPTAIAPFTLCLTPIRYEGQTREVADCLYKELIDAGIDTILDDRDARPGFKFADADLIGFPFRLNIGDKGLKEGKLELKVRSEPNLRSVPLEEVLPTLRRLLANRPGRF